MPRDVFLTAQFKIGAPKLTRRKRAALNWLLRQYGWAMQDALNALEPYLGELTVGWRENRRMGAGNTRARIYAAVQRAYKRHGLHSYFHNALEMDVTAALRSYFELKDANPNTAYTKACSSYNRQQIFYADALRSAREWVMPLGDENLARDALNAEPERHRMYRPALFVSRQAMRRHQGFTVLRDEERGRYLLVLCMYGGTNGRGSPRRFQQPRSYLDRLPASKEIFPLSMGGWHEERFFEKTHIQTARVVREGDERTGEFYAHVTFRVPAPDPLFEEPEAILGIDPGAEVDAGYALVDMQGRVRETGLLPTGNANRDRQHVKMVAEAQARGRTISARDYYGAEQDHQLHLVANLLVARAVEERALIVVGDVSLVSRRCKYGKLASLLDYKAIEAGLPRPRAMWEAYSSRTCSHCGAVWDRAACEKFKGKVGRITRSEFVCGECGFEAHADENAPVNIARRYFYRAPDWEKKGGWRAFHRQLCTDELGASE